MKRLGVAQTVLHTGFGVWAHQLQRMANTKAVLVDLGPMLEPRRRVVVGHPKSGAESDWLNQQCVNALTTAWLNHEKMACDQLME